MQEATPRELAEQLARRAADGPAGVLLDYDGTLAPIATLPEGAQPGPETRAALLALAARARMRVAVLTGRSVNGLLTASGPLAGITIAGNGGLSIVGGGIEWVHPDVARNLPALRAVATRLTQVALQFPGSRLEDKELSIALHFRLAPEAAAPLLEEVHTALTEEGAGLRLVHGKMVYEIQPDVPWDKGAAAAALLKRWGIDTAAMFIGDDVIDEPAFVEMNRRGALGVRVGRPDAATNAAWRLAGPADVQRTLEEIGTRL